MGGSALNGTAGKRILVPSLLLLLLNVPVQAQFVRSFQSSLNLPRPDAPTRTKIYAGLIAGAALYGLLAPEPDDFRIDLNEYGATVIPGTSSYRYFVRRREVTPEEFFRTMDNEKVHDRRAADERYRARTVKKYLRGVVFGTYLLMLADMLWLAPGDRDSRRVSIRLLSIPDAGSTIKNRAIGVRLSLTLR